MEKPKISFMKKLNCSQLVNVAGGLSTGEPGQPCGVGVFLYLLDQGGQAGQFLNPHGILC